MVDVAAKAAASGISSDRVRSSGSKLTVQLNMNLDIEIVLKAKIEGDITLTLL